MLRLRYVALGLIFVTLVFSFSCARTGAPGIGDITSNPSKFAGQTVTINGEYRGWESNGASPPLTRTDWVLKDSSGTIYVTGKSTGLDPSRDIGRIVLVSGTVKVKGNQAYIEAESIK